MILKTRLYKRPVGEQFIVRERLIGRLNRESDRPLKLIIAGAGYGKSVLMSQWLDTYRGKYCWISLEEDCNDLQIFLSYLVTAIQQKFPECMHQITMLKSSNQMPSSDVIAQILNNELLALPESLFIVLDDFHVIRNKNILNLFNEIIKFPPKNVQIALISRLDPPLNKTRIQAYQQVCEIRMADLKFNIEEIKELARRSVEADISDEVAEKIEKSTEGWALSVYLKIREFVNGDEAGADKQIRDNQLSNLAPFLFNLIESSLSSDGLKIVMITSLFDRFNSALIEELLKVSDEIALKSDVLDLFLKKLNETDSPLLISLDDQKRWFRMHHLIQELLCKKLFDNSSSDQISKYYKAAGVYFANHNYYEEGIQYSILGKDLDGAVNIITSNWEKLIDHGENLRLQRWLSMIPIAVINTNPILLVISAYLADTLYYDYNAMRHYLESASKHLDENNLKDSRLVGAFASVHSCFSAQTNDLPNALKFANQALDTLLPEQTFLKDYALNYKVLATSMIQSPAEAKALIDDFELISETPTNRSLMRVNAIKLMFNWSQGNLKALKLSGKIVIDIGKQDNDWWFYKMGCYYMTQYHYMKNQISEVYSYVDAGIDCFYNAGPAWTLQLYYSGVLAAIADNDLSKAGRYLMSAKKFIKLNKLEIFEGYLRAFEVEFALITNDVEKAWRLDRAATYSMHPPIKYYFIPQFTQIKLYIIKGNPELMKEANDLIQQYKKAVGNLIYANIQITLLEAVWYAKSGLKEKAISTLIEVLAFTPEEDYIRVYLDMGKPVHKMLLALPEEQKQMPLVRNIVMAFKHEEDMHPKKYESINLTPNELELMELVSSGMQNKEIADKLCLSDSTIKTYLYKIYQKLEVKNRLSAIRKLKELRLSQ